MKHVAFPFFTLSQSDPDVSDWGLIADDGSVQTLERLIPGWDYARDLRIQRTLRLSSGLVTSRLGLDASSSSFELIVRIGTGTGTLPRRLVPLLRADLRPGVPLLVDETVAGDQLSERLYLECSILAYRIGGGGSGVGSRLAPALPAAVVWRDTLDISLEGKAPRFPMEIVSFAERFGGRLESGAPWLLHWLPGELHRDFGGAVRLYLNHDRPDFVERFIGADPLTLQLTLGGVISQILSSVIIQEDLEDVLGDAEPSSVAGHVKAWLDLAFPSLGIAGIRGLLDAAPGRFNAAILAMADPRLSGDSE
jgi:hypothetical protein